MDLVLELQVMEGPEQREGKIPAYYSCVSAWLACAPSGLSVLLCQQQ